MGVNDEEALRPLGQEAMRRKGLWTGFLDRVDQESSRRMSPIVSTPPLRG